MRELKIYFRSQRPFLTIKNPKTISLEPNVRIMSVQTETPSGMLNYTIPLESINYIEDIIPVNMIQQPNMIIPGIN